MEGNNGQTNGKPNGERKPKEYRTPPISAAADIPPEDPEDKEDPKEVRLRKRMRKVKDDDLFAFRLAKRAAKLEELQHEPHQLWPEITEYRQRKFLAAFTVSCNISYAALAVGISEHTHYFWARTEPPYKAAFELAKQIVITKMEDEIVRRGLYGVPRKKFTKSGDPIIDPATGEQYQEREYSDSLIALYLSANAPEKYKKTYKYEHTGPNGTPLPGTMEVSQPQRQLDPNYATAEELQQLERIRQNILDRQSQDSTNAQIEPPRLAPPEGSNGIPTP